MYVSENVREIHVRLERTSQSVFGLPHERLCIIELRECSMREISMLEVNKRATWMAWMHVPGMCVL